MTIKNIVIYHDKCLDGTCAAWVASHYLPTDTKFFPVSYGKTVRDQIHFDGESNLYILDWCPEMDDLDGLCYLFNQVILIDHHESAIKKLQAHYDLDHYREIGLSTKPLKPDNLTLFLAHNNEWSGAMGTAIWFHNNSDQFKECDGDGLSEHWLVKAVNDRDRWQFKLGDTKAINKGLFHLGFNLAKWRSQSFSDIFRVELITTGITNH